MGKSPKISHSFQCFKKLKEIERIMTRQEAIDRWKDLVETVFWAEEAIAKERNERLHAAPSMTREEQQQFAQEYMTAIATEIVSRTTDEQLAKMK